MHRLTVAAVRFMQPYQKMLVVYTRIGRKPIQVDLPCV